MTKSGNRSYSQDPDVPAGIQPASKSLADPYNKGHMLGNRERSRTAVMRRQVCYYTNIAPQHSGTFNTGGGAEQPRRRDRQVLGRDQEFQCRRYALCGRRGLLQDVDRLVRQTASPSAAFGGQQAGVPTMFYYAMLRTKNAKSGKSVLHCSREELQCAAFVMSHAMQKGHKPRAAICAASRRSSG
ncbi:MAG: DNA/RNA non-specific endonuclease [Alistipes finegoldii]